MPLVVRTQICFAYCIETVFCFASWPACWIQRFDAAGVDTDKQRANVDKQALTRFSTASPLLPM
jgi:hypothetical protein